MADFFYPFTIPDRFAKPLRLPDSADSTNLLTGLIRPGAKSTAPTANHCHDHRSKVSRHPPLSPSVLSKTKLHLRVYLSMTWLSSDSAELCLVRFSQILSPPFSLLRSPAVTTLTPLLGVSRPRPLVLCSSSTSRRRSLREGPSNN